MVEPPRFFLARPPGDVPPELADGEALHALRVLRLGPGDPCLGLDGRGHTWPLAVRRASRRELALEVTGPPALEPAPGEPDAPLPCFEVAVAWPRRPRAEAMLARLTQLGAARITPLRTRQTGPQALPDPGDPRWSRILREALKQCRRAWLPALGAPEEVDTAGGDGILAVLDPEAGMGIDTWARSLRRAEGHGTPERPIVLVVGPEGGFDAGEREQLLDRGATAVRASPHVLRIETAAEAALAICAAVWMA